MLLLRLIKRNILLYARDRSNIFFSLLSTIIVIGLMVLFLGKMNVDNIVYLLEDYGGVRDTAADRANAEQLIVLWTLAGIVVTNSVSISLMMIGFMVEDQAWKRLPSFYVSPVNRGVFVMGYVIAAMIMSVLMCIFTMIIGEAYIVLKGGTIFSLATIIKILLYILLNVFTSTSMVFLMANLVRTLSAFSGLSTIVATLVGFFAGIYLPMGMLPENVQTLLKCFPLIHGCSFLRETFTADVFDKTFTGSPGEMIAKYKEAMGITIYFGDEVVSDGFKMAFLIASGVIMIVISAIIQRKRYAMSK